MNKETPLNAILVPSEVQKDIINKVSQKLNLPEKVVANISKSYFQLYFGLTCINWDKNGTKLGQAWQTSLSQIDSFVKSRKNGRIMLDILKEINNLHMHTWPKHIMISKDNENTFQGNETSEKNSTKTETLKKYGTKQIEIAMKNINSVLADVNKNVDNREANNAQQKTITENIRILLQQKSNQRSA